MFRPLHMVTLGLLICMASTFAADEAPAPAAADSALKTDQQKLGYAIGMQIGTSLQQFIKDVDIDALVMALRDTAADAEPKMTPQEAMAVQREFFTKKRAEMEAQDKADGPKNLAEGKAFLAKNKAVEGVTETDSGLQYMVLEKGDGPKPTAEDKVTVNYKGTLLDGTQFDSSYDRGQPASFPLNGVIPGWTEGLQLMPVGSKYKFFVPADLAYGEHGRPGIPPNSVLVFEVELISIDK